jgi:hypothetical protein
LGGALSEFQEADHVLDGESGKALWKSYFENTFSGNYCPSTLLGVFPPPTQVLDWWSSTESAAYNFTLHDFRILLLQEGLFDLCVNFDRSRVQPDIRLLFEMANLQQKRPFPVASLNPSMGHFYHLYIVLYPSPDGKEAIQDGCSKTSRRA